jgi:hypothetical protein
MERTNLRCDEIGGSSLGQRDEKSLLQTGLAAEPQITLLQSTEDNFATGRASSHGRMLPSFVQDGRRVSRERVGALACAEHCYEVCGELAARELSENP